MAGLPIDAVRDARNAAAEEVRAAAAFEDSTARLFEQAREAHRQAVQRWANLTHELQVLEVTEMQEFRLEQQQWYHDHPVD